MSIEASQRLPRTVVLLGSGELGRELTIALKRLGCRVVAVDTYPDAPAMQVADEARVIDMTHTAEVSALIDEVSPDHVIPEVEKLAVDALVAAEERGIDVVPSAKAVAATFDRRAIRELAAHEAKVPTSNYRFATSLDELREVVDQIGYPCFVKPTMSSSGHGQTKVIDPSQVEAAWDYAMSDARVTTGCVIVESMIDFDFEITVLAVRWLKDGVPTISVNEPIGHRQSDGDYVESWQPQPMSPTAWAKSQQIAVAVIEALASKDGQIRDDVLGLFGVELFICGDEVYFSEIAPRPHDTGMVTSITLAQSEFTQHARAVLGLPVDTTLLSPGASAVVKASNEAAGVVYRGVREALEIADDVRIFSKPVAHRGRRMGVVLASGEVEQARARASQAARQIVIESGD